MSALPAELIARLVCPATRAPLRQEGDALVCDASGFAYPIVDGVPVLLVGAARPVDQASS